MKGLKKRVAPGLKRAGRRENFCHEEFFHGKTSLVRLAPTGKAIMVQSISIGYILRIEEQGTKR